jgi:hydrogenase expression/formation protein HypD
MEHPLSPMAFRDPVLAHGVINEIHRLATRKWTIMEICGGQTHAILQYGIDELLQEQVELVHGPGCPV